MPTTPGAWPHDGAVSPSPGGLNDSSDTDNATMMAQQLSTESQIVLVFLYSLTTVTAVVGNAFVIVVFAVGKRSRSDLRPFLVNLACADLIMAVFCMPFTFTMTMLGHWIFSAPMCPVVLYMQTVSVTASVCTNMAIGVDRFWVVMYPLRSRITKSRSKVMIVAIWTVSLLVSSVQLVVGRSRVSGTRGGVVIRDCGEEWPEPSDTWRTSYTFFILLLTYLLPLFILSCTYGFVGLRLWQRRAPGNADKRRDTKQMQSKVKVPPPASRSCPSPSVFPSSLSGHRFVLPVPCAAANIPLLLRHPAFSPAQCTSTNLFSGLYYFPTFSSSCFILAHLVCLFNSCVVVF